MFSVTPRLASQTLLSGINLRLSISYEQRIPQEIPVIVISNHRSFLDAAILIKTLPYPLRIACHHYMGKTPLLKEIIHALGCFPLAETKQRQRQFFLQANQLLKARQWVGLFPEGAQPMVEPTKPQEVGEFQRGFAHLAWRTSAPNLAVLPVAIASLDETIYPTIPIRWLKNFDRNEPFFNRSGLHPMLIYHRVQVLIGRPYFINAEQKLEYQGKQAKQLANHLTDYCQEQIQQLLQQGCQ
ncbi:MAG: lysophospholipid acyltransferase family protein [Pleurocapsa sp.]